MTEDIEALLAAAERVSRVWRNGEGKTKDNIREAFNQLDWTVADIKKRMSRDSTRVIHRETTPGIQLGE